jgi:ribosomal-protein-serine acetyltransferase
MKKREFKIDDDLTLKELKAGDELDLFEIIDSQRTQLGEWLPFVELTKDVYFTKKFVDTYVASEGVATTWTVNFQEKCIGLVGLKDFDFDNHKTEIGYWLSTDFQGKNIMYRSCSQVIQYAFEELNMNRIQLKAGKKNKKSRTLASRLGFTFEGIERQGELHSRGFIDLAVYGLLATDITINTLDNY